MPLKRIYMVGAFAVIDSFLMCKLSLGKIVPREQHAICIQETDQCLARIKKFRVAQELRLQLVDQCNQDYTSCAYGRLEPIKIRERFAQGMFSPISPRDVDHCWDWKLRKVCKPSELFGWKYGGTECECK